MHSDGCTQPLHKKKHHHFAFPVVADTPLFKVVDRKQSHHMHSDGLVFIH